MYVKSDTLLRWKLTITQTLVYYNAFLFFTAIQIPVHTNLLTHYSAFVDSRDGGVEI